jgi:HPt (histidine-containing phosphotransfer) domain-containing protein
VSSYLDDNARCSEAKGLCWARSAALERVGGDESLLDELVALFLVESPRLVTQMQQALLHQDLRKLELAAHCLKGQLGYLGLLEASEAQKLEDAGRTGELRGAENLLAGLQIRLAGVWSILGREPRG